MTRKNPRNSELAQEHTTEVNIAGEGNVIKKSQRKNGTLFSFVTSPAAHLTSDLCLPAAASRRIQNEDG